MKLQTGWARRIKITVGVACAGLALFLVPGVAGSQRSGDPRVGDWPEDEFHLARMVYRTNRSAGSRDWIQPMWAVDYPLSDEHFLATLRRYTTIGVAEDSRHLELSDERLFKFPFLWLQQPGAGGWNPTKEDMANLREYLLRGGFMIVDDFHGEGEWEWFASVMQGVYPEKAFVDIPSTDPIMTMFFDIDQRTQIPGERHLRNLEQMYRQNPPHWRGLYDDKGRLMVAANHNMDMGDAWEHADDPNYPLPMTAFAYQLGVNYVLYALTH
jgi:hypothetical protein